MEKPNKKEEILEAALELFSVYGYEATSISQIADAVGVRKASLYSHYGSKQDILDKVFDYVLSGYEQRSIFANADWEDPDFTAGKENMTPEDVAAMVIGQINYIIHDPHISKGRKMITIGQFNNAEMAALQTRQNYTDVMKFFEGMMGFMIDKGYLKDANRKIMAAQFVAPITVWINLCDREPAREEEVMDLVRKHVTQFFGIYRR